ncbi:deoxyribonuclease IV [Oceanispirochaeta sp.]|jgi:deoxyribonuclease-4|uniref:deoxyribonuclease IV n=1 Tax=Oceanispirochaeta sp. TaxID=2035350 RepID=UPI0026367853|nr:deoxyribonuclease IV [Oceanispirochaeta sp.]MDA3955209.1 deoxyribonuclease IV [Oceanispirochaeta sp.]
MDRRNLKYIGPHVSIAGGVENAPLNALKTGATGFGMFTKNQRQWVAKPLTEESIQKFTINMKEGGFTADAVLPHDSYLINLGHPEIEKLEKSRAAFLDEVQRVEQLGLKYLNFHPGSHLKTIEPKDCLDRIAESINITIDQTEQAVLLIENTAGQGSNMGSRFEEIARIIEGVKDQSRVAVCLDTCHLFAAGYDLRTEETRTKTWADFDRLIGFDFLKGMHLNDAKSTFESHLDRHHSLGQGNIGWEAFEQIAGDPRFNGIPLVLETIDEKLWPEEVSKLLAKV